MKLISYFFISLSIVWGTSDWEEWELKKRTDNIEIYTRDVKESAFKEFKATTIFNNVSMSEVLDQIYKAPSYHENCAYSTSYIIEEMSSPEERFFYYSEKLPWPIKNRDVVTKLSLEEQSTDKIVLSIKAAPKNISRKDNTIRIQKLKGFWLLERHPEGIKATQQIYMDPGGTVPAFIVNSLIVKGPLKTFSTLKKTLKQ